MTNYEERLKIVAKDLEKMSKAWTDRIINSNLSHEDYIIAKAVSYTYRDAGIIIDKAIKHNPDDSLPDSFIPLQGHADPEDKEKDLEPNIHTVDIETGSVSRGSKSRRSK